MTSRVSLTSVVSYIAIYYLALLSHKMYQVFDECEKPYRYLSLILLLN